MNARSNAKEPAMSNVLASAPASGSSARIRGIPRGGRAGLGWLRAGSGVRIRLVLRRALRLHLVGDELPVGHQPAFHQGQRPVLECVWQRSATLVTHRHCLPLFFEDEIEMTRIVLDRAVPDVPRNAHALAKGGTLQRRDFRDRVVVGLALREPDVGERNQGKDDNRRADQEFRAGLHRSLPLVHGWSTRDSNTLLSRDGGFRVYSAEPSGSLVAAN